MGARFPGGLSFFLGLLELLKIGLPANNVIIYAEEASEELLLEYPNEGKL